MNSCSGSGSFGVSERRRYVDESLRDSFFADILITDY